MVTHGDGVPLNDTTTTFTGWQVQSTYQCTLTDNDIKALLGDHVTLIMSLEVPRNCGVTTGVPYITLPRPESPQSCTGVVH
ncbi:hypothetical protein M0804_014519 [Polistes exclamans]|nr:hypothetical protein M0804_014522 [Polistes exclamans]KAI4475095.1 hypothetical protein M0804_014519 [Polistes exclamans]